MPLIVLAPKINPFTSLRVTSLPLVISTDEKTFASSSVIPLPAPAPKLAAPVTLNTPVSVIAPALETVSVPLTVLAANAIAFRSVSVTF